jgi:hypothetical protein
VNAINRDKTRKIIDSIGGIGVDTHFASSIKCRSQSLLAYIARKDGVDLYGVMAVIDSLSRDVAEEKERLAEAAELASELAELESRKTA